MGLVPQHVTLIGAGQVGRALSKALRARAVPLQLLPFRRGLPKKELATDVVLICVRDGQIPSVVEALLRSRLSAKAVVAHVSGLLAIDVLAPLTNHCRAIGQLHPFSSIRAIGNARDFAGTYFVADGNRVALVALRRLVRVMGGHLVRGGPIDRARYHLAAALLANGSVALLHTARQLLTQAGIPDALGCKMLLELERSVLHNAEHLGFEAALTGPVRRGDVDTVRRHLGLLQSESTMMRELYLSLLRSQLNIVSGLGELEPRELRRMALLLKHQ